MKYRTFAAMVFLGLLLPSTAAVQGIQRVDYFADSIYQKEGDYIRLLGGSSWVLNTIACTGH